MADARIRKAWIATSDYWDDAKITVYADKRAKALYQLYCDSDCSLTFGQYLKRVHIWRDVNRDIVLPARHPLAVQINAKVLHCVVHAFGGTGLKAGYRDHFYTHQNDPMPKAAYYHGLFEMCRVPRSYAGSDNMVSYRLTDLGKNVARGEAETYPRW